MASIPQGILGALQGKIGPVTGYIRNGKPILRTAHSRPDGKITPARTAQLSEACCTEAQRLLFQPSQTKNQLQREP